ncbi:MAG: hypothetical protein ACLR3C_07890 [Eggerthella lenta]
MGPTVADIKQRLHEADEREFAVLERSLVADARKGVRDAVERLGRVRRPGGGTAATGIVVRSSALAAGRGDVIRSRRGAPPA